MNTSLLLAASLYVPIFTDIAITMGSIVGIILLLPFALIFALALGGRNETAVMAWAVVLIAASAGIGVCVWLGSWLLLQ